MSYAFPPPVPIGIIAFASYVLIILLALTAIVRVFAWHENTSPEARRRRAWTAIGLAAGIGLGGLVHVQTRGRAQVYLCFFATLFDCLAVMALVRQLRKTPASPLRLPIAGSLAALAAAAALGFPPWHPSGDCVNNLRGLEIAYQNAASGRSGTLPELVTVRERFPATTWRLELLSYVERLFDSNGNGIDTMDYYSLEESWDSPKNLRVGSWRKELYSCPYNAFPVDAQGRYFTDYAAVTGPKTAFPGGHGIALDAITAADGLSNTILIGECSGLNIVWTEPRDIDVSKLKIGINLPGDRPGYSSSIFSSYHDDGAHVAFADGHVRFLSEKIDPKVLQALTTATGGESVPEGASW